jgi:hypothetical protein
VVARGPSRIHPDIIEEGWEDLRRFSIWTMKTVGGRPLFRYRWANRFLPNPSDSPQVVPRVLEYATAGGASTPPQDVRRSARARPPACPPGVREYATFSRWAVVLRAGWSVVDLAVAVVPAACPPGELAMERAFWTQALVFQQVTDRQVHRQSDGGAGGGAGVVDVNT